MLRGLSKRARAHAAPATRNRCAKECPRGRSLAFPAGNVTFLPGIFAVCSDVSRYYEDHREWAKTSSNVHKHSFFPFLLFFYIYRVFRNLWDPLRGLVVRIKIMGKKSCKYMSYLSSFMRYNEFSVLNDMTTLHSKTSLHASCHSSRYSLYRSWCFSNLSEAMPYSISWHFSIFDRCCVYNRFEMFPRMKI